MIISSIDLFLSRDWAGGGGPAVDAPRFAFVAPAPSANVVVAGCVGACEVPDGAVGFAKLLNKLEADAGTDVDVAAVLVASEVGTGTLSSVFPRLENRLLEGALVEGADVPAPFAGLLKKPKALGAADGDDSVVVAED